MKTILVLASLLLSITTFAAEPVAEEAKESGPSFHHLLIGANAGIVGAAQSKGDSVDPVYGFRLGYNLGPVGNGFAHFVPTLAYYYTSIDMWFFGAYDLTTYEVLGTFKGVMNTGFYFGPKIGYFSVGSTDYFTKISSVEHTGVEYGIFVGYEFFKDSLFSFSPEVQYARYSPVNEYKALLCVNLNLF